MKEFENLIISLLSSNKRFINNSVKKITFNKDSLLFIIECKYKVPDTRIPMDNLNGEKEQTIFLSLFEIMNWATTTKIEKLSR